jgi:hypothetical protein
MMMGLYPGFILGISLFISSDMDGPVGKICGSLVMITGLCMLWDGLRTVKKLEEILERSKEIEIETAYCRGQLK